MFTEIDTTEVTNSDILHFANFECENETDCIRRNGKNQTFVRETDMQ